MSSGERPRETTGLSLLAACASFVFSAACNRLKVSVSSIMRRSGIISAASTAPRMNRTRQPQVLIASAESVLAKNAPDPTARRAPTSLLAAAQLAASPRRLLPADSIRKTMMPVYSAPTENPERQRKKTMPTPAQMPIVSYPGMIAIPSIATAMSTAETTNADLRPTLSPRWPKTMAPSGRNRNPAAPTPRVSRSESGRSPKNSLVRMVAT